MANFQFNANEEAPDSGRSDPIPAAWYNLMAIASEIKPTKAGTGTIVSVTLQVTDGQFAKRKIFVNFNTSNPSEKAEKIGRSQFSALCHAVGILNISATEQLHNIQFKGKVKVKPADEGYDAQNEIAQYKHFNDPSAGQTGAVVSAVQATRSMPPAPPVFVPPAFVPPASPAFVPPAVAVMSPEEAKWRAEQASIAASAAHAAIATPWTPPEAAQPWANQPVNAAVAPAAVPAAVAVASAPVTQAVPPWMVQPTA